MSTSGNTARPAQGTAGSARQAQSSAQSSAQQQASAKEIKEEETKDARFAQHWAQWSSIADKDRHYPVVINDTNTALKAMVTKLEPAALSKLQTVRRVPDLLDDPSKDLGTVSVAIVSADTLAEIEEHFKTQDVLVQIGTGERIAYIPQPKQRAAAASAAGHGTASAASQSSSAAPRATSTGTASAQGGNSGAAGRGKGQQQG